MLIGLVALAIAAAFTGAAVYINVAEHPARMGLETEAALAQWKSAYRRGALMQASLALLGGFAAIAAAVTSDWRWSVGGLVLIANWPYTLLLIMPLNNQLMALGQGAVAESTRNSLNHWNLLHVGRTGLGALAVLLMLWAAA